MGIGKDKVSMFLILSTFFLLYLFLHLYILLKLKLAFSIGVPLIVLFLIVTMVMTCTPILVHLFEAKGFTLTARFLSYAGYMWMGVVFLFFSVSLLFDFYYLLASSAELLIKNELSGIIPSVRFSVVISLLLALCLNAYGYFEAKDVRAERLAITTHKIPEEIVNLKIVHISDLHLGLISREKVLKEIIGTVKAENPDIIVSTGDLVDGQINDLDVFSRLLKGADAKYGKFAVTGNHEYYAGLQHALDFTEQAGFKVLRGEGLTVSGLINIVGVEDSARKYYGLSGDISEEELLSRFPRDKFTLLLKHKPVVDNKATGLFDLQLSGHTHRGQIFPFGLIVRLFFPFISGAFNLPDHSHLYVSRGAGTWGPPIRFLSPPEITVIELIHGE